MQWNEWIGQNCNFITLRNSHFFHVECKQPKTTKMHKTFIAQKSYCACRVLRFATISSKYYFNFILNRTRSGQELFDHPSYIVIIRWISMTQCLFNLLTILTCTDPVDCGWSHDTQWHQHSVAKHHILTMPCCLGTSWGLGPLTYHRVRVGKLVQITHKFTVVWGCCTARSLLCCSRNIARGESDDWQFPLQ